MVEVICIDDDVDNLEQEPIDSNPDSTSSSPFVNSLSADAHGEVRTGNRSHPTRLHASITNSGHVNVIYNKINDAVHGDMTLRSGDTVELLPGTLDYSLHTEGKLISIYEIFLRIEIIEQKTTQTSGKKSYQNQNQTFLTGYHFRRNRNCKGIIKGIAGEVLGVYTRRVRVCVNDVVQIRDMILTNALGPTTFRKSQTDAQDNDHGRLICRFKLQTEADINLEQEGLSGWNALSRSGSITRLTQAESDRGFGEDDDTSSTGFRGYMDSLDLNREYVFGDICCGAGGGTLGAEMAGFIVKFGNDNNVDSMQSWRLNRNPTHGAVGFCEDAFNFVTESSLRELVGNARHVDLLHLSIPCQTYSPAHTIPGKNDDDNSAMTGVIGASLCNLRPRIGTLEETDGIIRQSQHRHYFFWILWQFLAEEYNVSWNVLEALEYGCVSKRSRLIIIASCPGERLPSYPLRTHAWSRNQKVWQQQVALGGLRPPVTVGQALSSIPQHEKDDLRDIHRIDMDQPFLQTITTGSHHFLSTHHKALLQSFPPTYKFVGNKTSISKQIGNAFPPVLAAAVFRGVMKQLRRSDALRRMRLLQEEPDALAMEVQ